VTIADSPRAVGAPRFPATAGTWRWGERQSFFVDVDRRLRTPIPTSRRIAVLSLVGGAGSTTVAAGVARLAATRRATPVLAVDAAGARFGLGEQLGRGAEERITATDTIPADPQSFAEATRVLPSDGSLFFLGLGHPASASWAADLDEWHAAVAPVGRFFPLVITDWGRRRDLRAIADIARASHAVCLVAPADRAGLENAAALVPALRRETAAPDVMIALVDRSGEGPGATRLKLGGLDAPVLRIPFDSSVAEGAAPRRRTRLALLEVAAGLVSPRDAASSRAAVSSEEVER
jgi:MinD-like ATPase involved in chromosome partitioning or flagellar assembly